MKIYLCLFFTFLLLSSTSGIISKKQPEGTVECGVCEFVMFAIYSYVTANSTEAEITTIVGDICNYITSSYSDMVGHILRKTDVLTFFPVQIHYCRIWANHNPIYCP